MDLLKQLSGAAQEDHRLDLASLAQYVRAGRTNMQELQLERLREAHRIFDVQAIIHTCFMHAAFLDLWCCPTAGVQTKLDQPIVSSWLCRALAGRALPLI